MSRGFELSDPLIANMILFVNISNFNKHKMIYITTFNVARLDTLDDNFVF
jgi:hypothetical protein